MKLLGFYLAVLLGCHSARSQPSQLGYRRRKPQPSSAAKQNANNISLLCVAWLLGCDFSASPTPRNFRFVQTLPVKGPDHDPHHPRPSA